MDRYAFILLNLERFWNRLCDRNEAGKSVHSFVRRGLVGPKNAKLLLFYVTHPRKEIRGIGEFIERITGNSEDLWKTYCHESLLTSYEEYMGFLQGRKKATFIRFKNLRELPESRSSSVISQVTGMRRMPRMGTYITKEMVDQLI